MRRAIVGLVAVACMALGPNAQASTVLQEYHSSAGKSLSLRMPEDRDEGRVTVYFKRGGGYTVCLEVVGGEMRARWKRFDGEGQPVASGGDGLSYTC